MFEDDQERLRLLNRLASILAENSAVFEHHGRGHPDPLARGDFPLDADVEAALAHISDKEVQGRLRSLLADLGPLRSEH